MIVNSSLKKSIVTQFANSNLSNYEKIATEIIFYKYILSFLEENPGQENTINTLIGNYTSTFLNKFVELKNKYSCYVDIMKYLERVNANNIFSMNESDIDAIYNLYLNSKLLENFSISKFSTSIYGLGTLTVKQNNYLSHIHFDVLVPIIKYYMKIYKLKESDMKIVDCNRESLNIGKKIEFYIDGVSPSTIFADIQNKKIPIEISKIIFKYPNLEITNL